MAATKSRYTPNTVNIFALDGRRFMGLGKFIPRLNTNRRHKNFNAQKNVEEKTVRNGQFPLFGEISILVGCPQFCNDTNIE